MKAIEKELDRLVQEFSQNKRCQVCHKPAVATHHIIGRANPMTRYDPINLMPVCLDCHRDIHDGKINQWDYVDALKQEYLMEMRNASYKDFLIFVARQTEDEYFRDCKERLKKLSTS